MSDSTNLSNAAVTQDQKISQGKKRPWDQKSTHPTIEKLSQGYTRVPNSILMKIISGDLSKAEVKILLLIGRMTISYGDRETASLSKRGIERLTGMQGKTVLLAIQALKDKGLIKKIAGDQYTSNKLGLVFDEDLFGSESLNSEENSPQDLKGTHPEDQKVSQGEVQKSTHFKQYNINNNSKNTLSPEPSASFGSSDQTVIQDYFKSLKPEKKRVNEWRNYLSLRKDYSEQEIADAIGFLVKRGLPNTGDPCHSPMSFLGTAMQGVLEEVKKLRVEEDKRSSSAKQIELQRRLHEEVAAREEELLKRQELAFEKAFPTKEGQQAYFVQFAKRYPLLSARGPVVRTMAICAWASSQKQTTSYSSGGLN